MGQFIKPAEAPETPTPPDTGELKSIFRDHHDFAWRTLHHLGVPHSVIDDATQDVFMVVYRRLDDFDRTRSMKSWLYGIARRVASEYRRRGSQAAKRQTLVSETGGYADSWQTQDRVEAADLVHHFLERLDEGKRQVFLLAEVEGMTAPEIAETLDLNVNTVYARIRAARQRFAKLIRARQGTTRNPSLCRIRI